MANSPEGTVRDILAKRVGIGDNTLQRAIKIMEDAIDYSFNINFARRHLITWQKAEWVIKYEKAKEDLKASGRHPNRPPNGGVSGTTAEVLGSKVGVPERTMEDAIDYSFNINFARRNLNVYQKAEWVYKAEYAKTKRKLGGDRKSGSAGDSLGDTKDILAGKESFQVY